MTTVQAGLIAVCGYLQGRNVANPAREARLLLAHAMGVAPDRVSLMAQDPLADAALNDALALASRRGAGEPASHILGRRAFFGRNFHVDARVLDPRPETECLIAEALAQPFRSFLDLGTGSGAIAVTLAAERPQASGLATDLSEQALMVAAQNAATQGVADRIRFRASDWYQAVSGTFDLIASNPPYIAAAEMEALQPEVRLYEPRMALTDEADGLGAYRIIAAGAPDHLTPGGRLIVEIGPTQAHAVCEMMRDAGLRHIHILPDLDGRDRVVVGHMGH